MIGIDMEDHIKEIPKLKPFKEYKNRKLARIKAAVFRGSLATTGVGIVSWIGFSKSGTLFSPVGEYWIMIAAMVIFTFIISTLLNYVNDPTLPSDHVAELNLRDRLLRAAIKDETMAQLNHDHDFMLNILVKYKKENPDVDFTGSTYGELVDIVINEHRKNQLT